jgi:hypothetical protein
LDVVAAYPRPRQKLFPSIVEMLLTGEDVEFQAARPLVTALDEALSQ